MSNGIFILIWVAKERGQARRQGSFCSVRAVPSSPGLLLRALAEVRRYHAGEVSWTTGHLQATLMTHGPSLDRRFPWRFSRRRKASKPIELEELVPWTSSCRWRPPRRSAGRLTRASCVASGVSSCAWRAPGMTRTPC
jgi:hypothetical protein